MAVFCGDGNLKGKNRSPGSNPISLDRGFMYDLPTSSRSEGSLTALETHSSSVRMSAVPRPHASPASFQSPSLDARRVSDQPAHEMKFLLDPAKAVELERLLQGSLTLDPHADVVQGNSYALATLYCDTPDLAVFHRRGRYRLFKFRLRQYGNGECIYLERKSKRRLEVRKRRAVVELSDVERFQQTPNGNGWAGAWYHSQLVRNQFQPVCLLYYDRVAYFGPGEHGALRLTFDHNICGGLVSGWSFVPPAERHRLFADQVVCELKYRGPLPTLFKAAIESLQLVSVGISKYRTCLRAAGISHQKSPSSSSVEPN